jgi:hypothetical protein
MEKKRASQDRKENMSGQKKENIRDRKEKNIQRQKKENILGQKKHDKTEKENISGQKRNHVRTEKARPDRKENIRIPLTKKQEISQNRQGKIKRKVRPTRKIGTTENYTYNNSKKIEQE